MVHAASEGMIRVPQLDGLRGIAILLVLSGHIFQHSTLGGAIPLSQLAAFGVLLFFVLSGYLITSILTSEHSSTGSIILTGFYRRRILRLLPALLFFLAIIAALSYVGKLEHIRAIEFVACILYVRNFYGRAEVLAHLWSLSIEEQFYSAWPLLMKLVKNSRALVWTSGVAVFCVCVWRAVAIHLNLFDYGAGIYYTRTQFRIDSILIGCFLALFLANGGKTPKIIRSFPVSAIWLVVLTWTLIGESISRELYLTGQMVGAAWILFRSLTATRFFFLASAPLRFLGSISYSLYLWQQVFLEVKSPSWGPLQSFPVNLAASFACALASYFLIEKPFLRMKERHNSQGGQAQSLLNVACANGRSES